MRLRKAIARRITASKKRKVVPNVSDVASVVHYLLEDWLTPDAIALTPAETELKTELEAGADLAISSLIRFLTQDSSKGRQGLKKMTDLD
jgi:hypothetical protein